MVLRDCDSELFEDKYLPPAETPPLVGSLTKRISTLLRGYEHCYAKPTTIGQRYTNHLMCLLLWGHPNSELSAMLQDFKNAQYVGHEGE